MEEKFKIQYKLEPLDTLLATNIAMLSSFSRMLIRSVLILIIIVIYQKILHWEFWVNFVLFPAIFILFFVGDQIFYSIHILKRRASYGKEVLWTIYEDRISFKDELSEVIFKYELVKNFKLIFGYIFIKNHPAGKPLVINARSYDKSGELIKFLQSKTDKKS